MTKTMNPKVKFLIDPTIKKSGPDYTGGIADFGGGNMSQGMLNLWKDGEHTGLAEGVVGTAVVVGVCILIQKAVHAYRVKHAIAEPDNEQNLISTTPNIDPSDAFDNSQKHQPTDEETDHTE